MSAPGMVDSGQKCQECSRSLMIGEAAYASDWKVIDISGTWAGFRHRDVCLTDRSTTQTTVKSCPVCADGGR